MIQPGCRAFLEQLSLSGFSVFDATKLSKNTCCLNTIGRAIFIKESLLPFFILTTAPTLRLFTICAPTAHNYLY